MTSIELVVFFHLMSFLISLCTFSSLSSLLRRSVRQPTARVRFFLLPLRLIQSSYFSIDEFLDPPRLAGEHDETEPPANLPIDLFSIRM